MGNTVGSLNIKVGFDGSEAAKGLADLTNNLGKFGNDAEKNLEKFYKLGDALKVFAAGFGALKLADSIIGSISKLASDSSRAAVQWEAIQRTSEAAAENAKRMAEEAKNWSVSGPAGKMEGLMGKLWDSLTERTGRGIANTAKAVDDAAPGYMDNVRKQAIAYGRGDTGVFEALWNSLAGRTNTTADRSFANHMEGVDLFESEKVSDTMAALSLELDGIIRPAGAAAQQIERFNRLIDALPHEMEGVGVEGVRDKLFAAIDKVRIDEEIAKAGAELDQINKEAEDAAAKWAQAFEEVGTVAEKFHYNAAKLASELEQAQMNSDALGAEVAKRRLGKLYEQIMAAAPPLEKPVDPIAKVSLFGSQEAYRDNLQAKWLADNWDQLDDRRTDQEKFAEGLKELTKQGATQLEQGEKMIQIMQGQQGAKLAHLIN